MAGDNQPEATTTLENLSDVENESAAATAAAGEDEPLTTDDSTEPDCRAAIAEQSADTVVIDRKSTRLNSSHSQQSRMPSSA